MYNDPDGNPYPGGQGPQPQQNPYQQPPTRYNDPPYAQYNNPVPPMPGYVVPQQQPKQSLKWLWITLAIIGVVLLLGCGICGAVVYGVGRVASTATIKAGQTYAPWLIVNEYYQSIENQQYAAAYSNLSSAAQNSAGHTVTSSDFTTSAESQDTQKGVVTNFVVSRSPGIDSTGNQASYTVTVTRNGSSYTSTIGLKMENGTWKIVSYSAI